MAHPFEAVGCGKFKFFNSERGMSGEERSIIFEVVKSAEKTNSLAQDWFESLSKQEAEEYDKLFEEDSKIKDEMYKGGCYDLESPSSNRPACCINKDGGDKKKCLECPLYKRDIASEERIRDFRVSHGKHICNDCGFYCRTITGQCDLTYSCKHPTDAACANYTIETDEEYSQRNKLGVYETDELRNKREQDSTKDCLYGYRRDRAVKIAGQLASMLETYATLLRMDPGYYKKMFDDFPDVFAKTNYKTFEDLKRACDLVYQEETKI